MGSVHIHIRINVYTYIRMSSYFVAQQYSFVFSPVNYVIVARNFMLKMLQVLQLEF